VADVVGDLDAPADRLQALRRGAPGELRALVGVAGDVGLAAGPGMAAGEAVVLGIP
jgi:hypothetical protein